MVSQLPISLGRTIVEREVSRLNPHFYRTNLAVHALSHRSIKHRTPRPCCTTLYACARSRSSKSVSNLNGHLAASPDWGAGSCMQAADSVRHGWIEFPNRDEDLSGANAQPLKKAFVQPCRALGFKSNFNFLRLPRTAHQEARILITRRTAEYLFPPCLPLYFAATV